MPKKTSPIAATSPPTGDRTGDSWPREEDTPYRRACRRSWARLIEKVYLISPLICPRCHGSMKILEFIEDFAVIRKILQHLHLWETTPRPPPKKPIPFTREERIWEGYLPLVADPIYPYDNVDPVYQD